MSSKTIGWTIPVVGATIAVLIAAGVTTWLIPRGDYGQTEDGFAPVHRTALRTADAQSAQAIEDFFYYSCPHCRSFEPSLEAWAKNAGAQDGRNALTRIPVTGGRPELKREAALFYALESMGAIPRVQEDVFQTVARSPDFPASDAEIVSWAAKEGLSPAVLLAAFHSPDMETRIAGGDAAFRALDLSAVPALAVHDRWIVTPATAGGMESMTHVLDKALRAAPR
ncbi:MULTISPECIES: thioredoxin domain-containing protein [unclassified Paraburkholderia]|uniref:thioredoxin domain-containing protein n=1 Tax=unclassified Paraburkholderia TaxID=2615204 RepID=UPI002AB2FD88|nr:MULTISPECIES: thioredoxin domain-containing protein [unclassified Paraburkholderia]